MPRNATRTAKQSSLRTNRFAHLYIKKAVPVPQKNKLRSHSGISFIHHLCHWSHQAFRLFPFGHAQLLFCSYTFNNNRPALDISLTTTMSKIARPLLATLPKLPHPELWSTLFKGSRARGQLRVSVMTEEAAGKIEADMVPWNERRLDLCYTCRSTPPNLI